LSVNNNRLVSIKSALRVISLREYLLKNDKTLRFGKKVYIFKQII